jgi:hypothetical protein
MNTLLHARWWLRLGLGSLCLAGLAGFWGCQAPPPAKPADAQRMPATLYAEVVALDQVICYNRFGSHNPYGMIYALKEDVVAENGGRELSPGRVRLRDDQRPRPLVLRMNVGDTLHVRFTNLLHPDPKERYGDLDRLSARCPEWAQYNAGKTPAAPADPLKDAPLTRTASLTVNGLTPVRDSRSPDRSAGLVPLQPGEQIDYYWKAEREGEHLFYSLGAPSGGQGDGGSLVHGLFGAVIVEPAGSRWYRSAVTADRLAAATRNGIVDYEAADAQGIPLLNLLRKEGPDDYRLVGGGLDAIVVGTPKNPQSIYREFTVMFHDELKTRYAAPFQALDTDDENNPLRLQVVGVRDGFGVNYGASGLGTILLANRAGLGPAGNCPECFYEEFFLQSWANGDPALLARYPDDPANVHHSYLNDRVVIHNFHAGPKETHVFHLHAHQWESSQSGQANYLDSQTIAPLQGYGYRIAHNGSGNLNKTPGDSIFHCHLYPHFAQGMWGLWRVHDVFEDGTRRLPDGLLGTGTDPLTGTVAGGTPIPAVTPLPGQAMPPRPDYLAQVPGYPFYIPGEPGHRAPQPPLDMAEDAGLPRHVVIRGERTFPGGPTVPEQFQAGDLEAKLTRLSLRVLPENGTPLEKKAMQFHARTLHPSRTPEGRNASFITNGRAPQPGSPFADPCGPGAKLTRYQASIIDTDLVVNKHGWHDPQARINVLDGDVAQFEGKPTDRAEPFFFRVHSGDCVEFRHTNRTAEATKTDHFQVATPTDTVGQHIHLVKFDVTSSDGSGNGFNYEDGTFARAAVEERIDATHGPGGSAVDDQGRPVRLEANGQYQATLQRWWVDPHYHYQDQGHGVPPYYDATLGTVFTHDHFAPSTIQQHGFYNAMLVEPQGSTWTTPDGQPLAVGAAVGSRANVVKADDPAHHPDHREFALAVADFALLYDCGSKEAALRGGCPDAPGFDPPAAEAGEEPSPPPGPVLARTLSQWSGQHGAPVDPPKLPEAISTHHHDPYLVNYKNEPIPLRMFERDSNGHFTRLRRAGSDDLIDPADSAWLFSSYSPHGDPFLAPFLAYEGDRVQFRLIQGAQEVQHTFNLHGLHWRREPFNPNSPRVAAQEIGISEHFEMDLPKVNVSGGVESLDYLYTFGSTDAMWNGAWSLLRVFAGPDAPLRGCGDAPCATLAREKLAALPANPEGRVERPIPAGGACPAGAPVKPFCVRAVQAGPMHYDPAHHIADPDALAFVLDQVKIADPLACDWGHPLSPQGEPLVIRANAGDCLVVHLKNDLPSSLPDTPGDARLPGIVSVNAADIPPSSRVSLRPQIVPFLAGSQGYGFEAGFNAIDPAPGGRSRGYHALAAGQELDQPYRWYAGLLREGEAEPYLPTLKGGAPGCPSGEERLCREGLGPVNLASFGDVMEHVTHGLFGGLIVEPAGATYYDPAQARFLPDGRIDDRSPTLAAGGHALVARPDGSYFREHVLFYQDGLNLHRQGRPIPDCLVCDDSYDLGERGVSYRSAPFWARLGLDSPNRRQDWVDLNTQAFPPDFFLASQGAIPTPTLVARAGEAVRIHVLQPGGRSRQRTFTLLGHGYADLPPLPRCGSPGAALISPGKAITAELEAGAAAGTWLYRDGPANMFSGGAWGQFVVEPR